MAYPQFRPLPEPSGRIIAAIFATLPIMKMPLVAGSATKLPGLTSLILIALFTGLAVFWGMSLTAPAVSIAPAGSLVSASGTLNTAFAAGLFGQVDGAAPVASAPLPRNIKVLGIMASADRSAAIITIDGRSPAAFGVGQEIDEGLKIVSVDRDEVVFDLRGEQIKVPSPASTDASALNNPSPDSASVASSDRPAGMSPPPRGGPIPRQAPRQARSLNAPAPPVAGQVPRRSPPPPRPKQDLTALGQRG